MPFYDFAAIKAAYSFANIIDKLGLELKQSGNQWRGECPACKTGGDRALVITEGKGYYCHSAKQGGDQLALYAHIRDISIKDAAGELAGTVQKVPSTPTSTVAKSVPHGFDRAKYQATLDRKHETLKDIPPDLLERADIGVSSKGALKGIVLPLYDKDTHDFICYAHVESIQLPNNVTQLKKAS